MKSEDTHNAISLRGSVVGLVLSDLLDGATTDQFGQVVALASHFLPPEKEKVKPTSAIYGRSGSISSASANLQLSLESKLQQRLPTVGWTASMMIWKKKVTPAGRQICQLAVSVPRIKEKGFGLWQSPTAKGNNDSPSMARWPGSVAAAVWPTPQARDYRSGGADRAQDPDRSNNLNDYALWATPNTMDTLPPRSQEAKDRQFNTSRKGRTAPANLREQVLPSMWPTASSRDHKGGYIGGRIRKGKISMDTLDVAAQAACGGSNALTEKQGQLNPAFVCWLMGYPTVWESCADTVTPLSRASQQNLSLPAMSEIKFILG